MLTLDVISGRRVGAQDRNVWHHNAHSHCAHIYSRSEEVYTGEKKINQKLFITQIQ